MSRLTPEYKPLSIQFSKVLFMKDSRPTFVPEGLLVMLERNCHATEVFRSNPTVVRNHTDMECLPTSGCRAQRAQSFQVLILEIATPVSRVANHGAVKDSVGKEG